jgi:hypothetical protein
MQQLHMVLRVTGFLDFVHRAFQTRSEATQFLIQWLPGIKLPRREMPLTSTSAEVNADLYIHFPIRLHGIVRN